MSNATTLRPILAAGCLVCQVAAAFTPGNVLVSEDNFLYEYTTGGQIVGTMPMVYPGGYSGSERARDLIFDANGSLHVFNGTYSPYLSTYEPSSGFWSHVTTAEWDTDNNVSYGGIGVLGERVFVTDMSISVGPSEHGVVMFNLGDNTSTRFANDLSPTDLTLGLDGLLYVLNPDGMYFQNGLVAYDPVTLAHVRDIDISIGTGLRADVRAVAVNSNGDIFIADWEGVIYHMDKDARLLDSITIICDDLGFPFPIGCSLSDIDIAADGTIVLGDRYSHVFVTDIFLSPPVGFLTNYVADFVTVVPAIAPDSDGDGIADASDNCTQIQNADQRDTNVDGFGNVCDPDLNNDLVTNPLDLDLLKSVFLTPDPDADFNGDGAVNFQDLAVMKALFFQPPGPSGQVGE